MSTLLPQIKEVIKTERRQNKTKSKRSGSSIHQNYSVYQEKQLTTISTSIIQPKAVGKIYVKKEEFKRLHSIQVQKANNQQKDTQQNEYQPYCQAIDVIQKLNKIKDAPKRSFVLFSYLKNNIFFRKIGPLLGQILLRVGKIIILNKYDTIYQSKTQLKYVYIILFGKIKLKDKQTGFRKYSINGQTLCQEALIDNDISYHQRKSLNQIIYHQQTAKCQYKSVLLKIKVKQYFSILAELIQNGFKSQLIKIENIFKLNYLNKSSVFHQANLRKQSLSRQKKKN